MLNNVDFNVGKTNMLYFTVSLHNVLVYMDVIRHLMHYMQWKTVKFCTTTAASILPLI